MTKTEIKSGDTKIGRTEEWAQLVMGLLCNREGLSLDPRHPHNSQEQQRLSVTLVPELINELQAQ